MPTLHWIGKDKIVNHHQEVPFRILERQYTFKDRKQEAAGRSENKIIHGDNLEALKSLLPEYEGRIECIYIDPPYNTGNEGWAYNDNVSHPKLKKWLGEVVGKDGEDLSRHDKWLCMMYPRIKLLHKLLAPTGKILISIDDNEHANLVQLCNEIFGLNNHVTSAVWEKSKRGDAKLISVSHEYLVVYTKNKSAAINQKIWRRKKKGVDNVLEHYLLFCKKFPHQHDVISKQMIGWYNSLEAGAPEKKHKHYRYSDERGLYFPDNFAGPNDGRKSRPRYDILHPTTGKSCKKPSTGWRWEESRTAAALEANPAKIHFGEDETTIPCRKSYLKNVSKEPLTSVFYQDGRAASKMLHKILHKGAFDFPKNVDVIQEWIEPLINKDSIVLDSFAGSGSTAHAVLNLNKQDGGNRKFILIEMEDYAEHITAERVKRVMGGYGQESKRIEGTGGDFTFFNLGKQLFKEGDVLNEEVGEEDIKKYIWFSETKSEYNIQTDSSFLGIKADTAYYFYYQKDNLTTLDEGFLRTVKVKAGQYIIYADNCLLDEKLMDKYHIVFKKIPRDITRF